MKFIPLIGIALGIIGLITLDWYQFGFGLFLFFCGFLIDYFKKRGAIKDGKVFPIYRVVNELILTVRKSIELSELDMNNPKVKLAQGLFFMGMLDSARQATSLSDKQFLNLFKAVFTDLSYDFDKNFKSKILLFHQSLNTQHDAFPAIIKGGEFFIKFTKGYTLTPVAGAMLIKEIIEDQKFPESVDAL